MTVSNFIRKVRNRWKKFRLQPIRVYCLHHVCAEFDAESMNAGDWIYIDEFMSKVKAMQDEGITFISLTDAYSKITNDIFRSRKFAVLTFDDGYASLKEILPWLEGQQIPVILFINGKYLDGKSYRTNPMERYLTCKELFALSSPLIEVGSHGWVHIDATKMTEFEFSEYIDKNSMLLSSHPRYISFHAYTWGRHTDETDTMLQSKNIVPVYIDGMKNYNETDKIHRELL